MHLVRRAASASRIFFFSLFFVPLAFAELDTPPVPSARASQAMVVTAHPFATEVAWECLEAGGNAVDSAIAAQWVLNVVEPQSSGIGGGGFFLYYDSKTKAIHAFDGREKAPHRATPKMFLDPSGAAIPFYPDRITGGLPVGVPGTLRLLKEVHDHFGSKLFRFDELLEPAIQLAREGMPVSKRLSDAIREEENRLKRFEASRKIFFHPSGEPYREGEILVQPDLAKTFETIREKGTAVFYEGEIARAIVDSVQKAPFHPGLLELADLKFFRPAGRESLYGTYRGYDLFTIGPPSSGGVALLQILNILENFSLPAYGPAVDSFHLMMEAQKIAFEDRLRHLGDPDFVKVPVERLTSKKYGHEKAKRIDFEKALPIESSAAEASLSSHSNTSHLSIRDPEGNLVSYTTTIEHVFGSAMVVPGWGFLLNNELTDFDAEPLGPNAPGPEKRPRSSMCPVIVFRNGKPFLIAGSPGGSLIIPTVQEIIVNVIDFGMSLERALASPRFAARTASVEAEPAFLLENPEFVEALKARGHTFTPREPFGNAQAILLREEGEIVGVSDPRGGGEARGY